MSSTLPEDPDAPAPPGLARQVWEVLAHNKVWWLTPFIIGLVALLAFILFAEGSLILPLIYTVF